MKFISFFTKEGQYKAFADNLVVSLKKFDLNHSVEELPSQGHWGRNNSLKPNFILKHLLNHRDKVVWLDCDTEIIERPILLENNFFDFSIFRWTNETFRETGLYTEEQLKKPIEMFSGGVIGFNYTAKSIEFLLRWIAEVNKRQAEREDKVLDEVYSKFKDKINLNCWWLPKSYNRMGKHWANIEPIIEHHWEDGAIYRNENIIKPGTKVNYCNPNPGDDVFNGTNAGQSI